MLPLALVLAAVAGLLHVVFFLMESVLFRRPEVHRRFGTRSADVDAVRPWAFNQGFYNLFLAAGAFVGVGLAAAGVTDVGLALLLLSCGSMVGAALVLVATDRRMARAALLQGLIPALAVVASILALGS